MCHPSIVANVVGRPRAGEEPDRLGLPFWQLWSASTLSNLADGLVKIALPLVAVTLTDSPGLVAGVTLAVTLPWLLFALPAGALADKAPKRTLLLATESVAMISALLLALLLYQRPNPGLACAGSRVDRWHHVGG